MFCTHCGSQIPDGSRFCTECGAPVSAPESSVPEPDIPSFEPDIPSFEPDAPSFEPDIPAPEPDIPAPEPDIPAPEPDIPAPEPDIPAPAYTTPAYSAPAEAAPAYAAPASNSPEAAPSAPVNEFGYSVVGGGAGGAYASPAAPRPVVSPEIESKPLFKRWWFWVIVGLLAVVLIVVIAASALTAKTPPAVSTPDSSGTNSLRASLSDRTADIARPEPEAIEPEIPEQPIPEEPERPAPELPEEPELPDAGDGSLTLEECVAEIEKELTESGLSCEIETDEDDWVYTYIWWDGLDDLAYDAYSGDEDALAEWNDVLSELTVLSYSYSQFFAESGQPQAISYVALQDDLDEDVLLSIALDGELVFDVVTEVDIYGILEE